MIRTKQCTVVDAIPHESVGHGPDAWRYDRITVWVLGHGEDHVSGSVQKYIGAYILFVTQYNQGYPL